MKSDLIRRRDALVALLAEEGRELERAVDDTQELAEYYTDLGAVMSNRPAPFVLTAFAIGFLFGQLTR
ncbi:MAG: hypothetical protein H6744_05660 [Deltaproteobacteria bacterium]|nr:hypothetical protein [Deltaproteobacteria bacterium]MCB9786166.1 hypothetical protein [Deltaproteobacteria bacterium]